MAQINTKNVSPPVLTHEGGPASKNITPAQLLRRLTMATLLWEDNFYIDGQSQAEMVQDVVKTAKPEDVAAIAIEAREKQNLRHIPLLLVRELARRKDAPKGLVKDTLERIIQRVDELTEFVAIYRKDNPKEPFSAQVKKGLAAAFNKFNAFQFAKYDRDNAWKIRDVAFMVHPNPKSREQAETFARLFNTERFPEEVAKELELTEFKKLDTPDTWETALSSGEGKKTEEQKQEQWSRLLVEKKLGALALLRNLRNMEQAGVEEKSIREALLNIKPERVLPFRFIAAANVMPKYERELEAGMMKCLSSMEKLPGKTLLVVDVSGSMQHSLSMKSDISRIDAATGLAMLISEIAESFEVWSFADDAKEVNPRKGFALRDAISKSQPHGGTYLGRSLQTIHGKTKKYDRIIVITDEQSHDAISAPKGQGYIINVAGYKNGIGYGPWTKVDGWSESVIQFIQAYEKEPA